MNPDQILEAVQIWQRRRLVLVGVTTSVQPLLARHIKCFYLYTTFYHSPISVSKK